MLGIDIDIENVIDNIKSGAEVAKEKVEDVLETISETNKEILENLSEKAREFADNIYESIHEAKEDSRLVAKGEIAFDQVWLNKYSERSNKWSEKVSLKEKEIAINEERIARNEARILQKEEKHKEELVELEQIVQEYPNKLHQVDRLKIAKEKEKAKEIQELQKEIEGWKQDKIDKENQKDIYQSKLELNELKTKNWTEKRNLVAERLTNRYDEKLKPFKASLEEANKEKNNKELEIIVNETKLNQRADKIAEIEQKFNELRKEHDAKPWLKRIFSRNPNLPFYRQLFNEEKNELFKDQSTLYSLKEELIEKNEEIAKIYKETLPYIQRRAEFDRILTGKDTYLESLNEARKEREARNEELENIVDSVISARDAGLKGNLEDKLTLWGELLNRGITKKRMYNLLIFGFDRDLFYRKTGLLGRDQISYEEFRKIMKKYMENIS